MTNDREAQWTEWMRAAQDGDAEAYGMLLEDIVRPITAFVRKRCRDEAVVEDVVQEILLALHRARHTYNPQYAFAPWMFAITRNRFIDNYRKRKRRGVREVPSTELVDQLGRASEVRDESISAPLQQALEHLSEKQRTVVELLKIHEFTVAEIAVQLDMSESAVKVTAHRAYKKMRKLLGDTYES